MPEIDVMPRPRRLLRTLGFVLGATLALAACQEAASDLGSGRALVVAPAGIPIAIESMSGGAEPVRGQFASALQAEGAPRKLEFVGAGGAPRYHLRGYLDAYTNEQGAGVLTYVFDLYDNAKKRASRIEGAVGLTGSGDAWARVDDASLRRAAGQGANEIAAFLAGGSGPAQPPAPAEEPVATRVAD